jgi:hypothetical protein
MKSSALSKLAKTALTLVGAATMASSAHAAVYSYNLTGGSGHSVGNSVLSIDTTAGTGSVVGAAINAVFSGDFSTFTGGTAPTGMFNIALTPASTITYNGKTYTPLFTGHQEMLDLFGTSVNLWATWSTPTSTVTLGDYVKNISSSSTGGTSVPEPGMLGLMALGVIALGLSRRRQPVRAAA